MTLQELLDQRNISKYKLSKMTGIPKTTIMDICAGRSDIARCSARTVQLLARGLGCTMEEIMDLSEEYMEYALDVGIVEMGQLGDVRHLYNHDTINNGKITQIVRDGNL